MHSLKGWIVQIFAVGGLIAWGSGMSASGAVKPKPSPVPSPPSSGETVDDSFCNASATSHNELPGAAGSINTFDAKWLCGHCMVVGTSHMEQKDSCKTGMTWFPTTETKFGFMTFPEDPVCVPFLATEHSKNYQFDQTKKVTCPACPKPVDVPVCIEFNTMNYEIYQTYFVPIDPNAWLPPDNFASLIYYQGYLTYSKTTKLKYHRGPSCFDQAYYYSFEMHSRHWNEEGAPYDAEDTPAPPLPKPKPTPTQTPCSSSSSSTSSSSTSSSSTSSSF